MENEHESIAAEDASIRDSNHNDYAEDFLIDHFLKTLLDEKIITEEEYVQFR